MSKRTILFGLAAALVLTSILLLRTCNGSRDAGCVEQALLGHWQTTSGDELYYGPDLLVAVAPEGTVSHHPYRVLMYNDKESWLKILISNTDGKDVERVIQFGEDRNSYRASHAPGLDRQSQPGAMSTAHYVDAEMRP